MRLGQAARSLNTTTDKIVVLLKDNFREVNNHPNIKLTDEEMAFIESQFAPVVQEEETVEKPIETLEEEINLEEPSEKVEKDFVPEFVEDLRPKVITLEKEFDQQTEGLETFKAEKISLEGLKVVGKIELPEPKVIEKEVEEEEPEEKPIRRERKNSRSRSREGRNKQGLSPAEERAKAERLAYRKKLEQEERQKQLKKKHYEQNVKTKIQSSSKPKRKKKKELQETVTSQKPTPQKSKKELQKASGVKRLWLWLNGAYDRFD